MRHMIVFITQDICDYVSMYLSLTKGIDVKIKRIENATVFTGGTFRERNIAQQYFAEYIRELFQDANFPPVS